MPSKSVFEREQWCHAVAHAVVVQREQQVAVDEQSLTEVELEANRSAQRIEGIATEDNVRERRHPVARDEGLLAEALRTDVEAPEQVERQGQAGIHRDIRARGVSRLIGKIRGLTGRR